MAGGTLSASFGNFVWKSEAARLTGLEFALIIGTLEGGSRFIANSEKDEALLNKMMTNEMLDAKVSVAGKNGKNIFNLI